MKPLAAVFPHAPPRIREAAKAQGQVHQREGFAHEWVKEIPVAEDVVQEAAQGPHIACWGEEVVELHFGGGEGGRGANELSDGIVGAGIGECGAEITEI